MRMRDTPERIEPEDMVAVLTRRGDVVWSRGPHRATFFRPCVINSRGVRLYRWPLRSMFIPLERIDRFDEVEVEDQFSSVDSTVREPYLALLTRDGKRFAVTGVNRVFTERHLGLPPKSRAQQLNNHLPRTS